MFIILLPNLLPTVATIDVCPQNGYQVLFINVVNAPHLFTVEVVEVDGVPCIIPMLTDGDNALEGYTSALEAEPIWLFEWGIVTPFISQ